MLSSWNEHGIQGFYAAVSGIDDGTKRIWEFPQLFF